MTQIEALIKEVEDAPGEIVAETLDFVRFLKFQRTRQEGGAPPADWTEQDARAYAARSLQCAAQLYGDEEDLLPLENTPRGDVLAHIGHLSKQDWQQVCARVNIALGITTP